ncbi:MAG: polyprenyl synthetase family protein [Nocardioides sp.]
MTDWDPAAFAAAVQTELDAFLDRQAERLGPLGADAERLLAQARQAVAGGKRFRATFCWWGYRAVRPEPVDTDALVRACASLELLHASALVHDDYMDASETRRGRPAVHRFFAEEHAGAGWPGDSTGYGAAAAILLGDLLQAWADELLRLCGLPVAEVASALELFDHTRTEVIAGQFLDVSVQARGHSDVDEAMRVLRFKSAKYSVERPLHIGAALAGGGPKALRDLTAYGLPLGEAFQLRDDLLGVFGDPDETGKPAGDDLVEGKRTVLVALALDGASPSDRDRLNRALGTELGQADVAALRRIIVDAGAAAAVEDAIAALTDRALSALAQAELDAGAKDVLRELAATVTDRTV